MAHSEEHTHQEEVLGKLNSRDPGQLPIEELVEALDYLEDKSKED